ncbi:nitrogenase component 1 [Calothrix sp. UHCC 0171]|uniref:nitrogenase component 1 n=1 Tax=Calothrix sp. UHCC 0171 TaxID=3110245 RepID=UPI002B212EBA|nr:nitrogenase component 1 [Calothrix sp. UHCC 0171]MEA5574404.1 nitrogenase component 1 [Calothrix sp. UHCC 0171]
MSAGIEFENCDHSKDPIVGCALEGIATTVAGIQDVSIVIHSPQGCASTVAAGYDVHEVDFTKRKVGCTRLFESDIVMGASEKLKNLIKEADKSFNSKVMFVVGTCAADIIGEDIEALCKNLQPEINAKLVPMLAGGFRGNGYDGLNMGLEALLPFIKKQEKTCDNRKRKRKSVNIIAPQANINPTWWADLKWVTETLESLGIKVQSVFSHNTAFEDIENAGHASANIILSHDMGYKFAKKMQNTHDIPVILNDIPLPIGVKNTTRWLRALAEYFRVEKKVEPIIQKGEEMVVDTLRRRALMIIPRYRNCRVAVSADGTIGIGLVRMLFEELEMIPELLLFRSAMPEARGILEQELQSMGISPKVVFSADGYQIKNALEQVNTDAVLGSAWEKYMAEELDIKIAFDVFSPTNRETYLDKPYFGYEGMINMMEVIANDWERAFRSKHIHWTE